MPEISLTTSHVITAPRARVYEAWLDPKRVAELLTVDPDEPVRDVRIDAEVGGLMSLRLDEDDDSRMDCRYSALEPGALIAFSWDVAGDRTGSRVTIHLRQVAEGCEIVLMHQGLANRIVRDVLLDRWDRVLRNLVEMFGART